MPRRPSIAPRADARCSSSTRTALWRLYLVELLRRMAALRQAGFPVERLTQGPAALVRLERGLGLATRTSWPSGDAGDRSDTNA